MAREQRTRFVSRVGPGLPRVIPGKEIGVMHIPRTQGDFAHPEPYHVWSNSRVWRKRGIGVAST